MKSPLKAYQGRKKEKIACGLDLLVHFRIGLGFQPMSGGAACSYFPLSSYAGFKVRYKVCVYACCLHLCFRVCPFSKDLLGDAELGSIVRIYVLHLLTFIGHKSNHILLMLFQMTFCFCFVFYLHK